MLEASGQLLTLSDRSIPLVIAFGYSLLVGQLLIRPLFAIAYGQLGGATQTPSLRWQPAAVGYVERMLYTASWIAGRPELAAVWLALKVAGQWGRWQADRDLGHTQVTGRSVYNQFLLGSGLSLAYGVAGGMVFVYLANGDNADAVIAALAPVLLTILVTIGAVGRAQVLFPPAARRRLPVGATPPSPKIADDSGRPAVPEKASR